MLSGNSFSIVMLRLFGNLSLRLASLTKARRSLNVSKRKKYSGGDVDEGGRIKWQGSVGKRGEIPEVRFK